MLDLSARYSCAFSNDRFVFRLESTVLNFSRCALNSLANQATLQGGFGDVFVARMMKALSIVIHIRKNRFYSRNCTKLIGLGPRVQN